MEHTKDRKQVLRIGIGGPVGSGKTALVDGLCKSMRDEYRIAVVTQRYLHQGRPAVSDPQSGAGGRSDRRRRDRRMPAYRDPARTPPSTLRPSMS